MRRGLARVVGAVGWVVTLRWAPVRTRQPGRLATLYAATALVLWLTLGPRPAAEYRFPKETVLAVVATPGGHALAVFTEPGATPGTTIVNLFRRVSPDSPALRWPLPDNGSRLNEALLSPTGRYLAVACEDRSAPATSRRVLVWDDDGRLRLEAPVTDGLPGVRFGKMPRVLPPATVARFAPDERTLAVAGEHKGRSGVALWDLTTQQVRGTLPRAVPPLSFSPDGETVATAQGLHGERLRLWKAATGDTRADVKDPVDYDAGRPRCLPPTFSADGQVVARLGVYPVPGDASRVWVGPRRYDAATGAPVGGGTGVSVVCADEIAGFAGDYVVVRDKDGARVHDPQTGALVTVFAGGAWPTAELATDGLYELEMIAKRRRGRPLGGHGECTIMGAPGSTVLAAAAQGPAAPDPPWESGWSPLDGLLRRAFEYVRGEELDVPLVETQVRHPGRAPLRLPGWYAIGFTGDDRYLVTVGPRRTRLAVWGLPLRPPWPLILGYAAVPPGLMLLAVGLRRAVWRRQSPVNA